MHTNPKIIKPTVPWDTLALREKRADVKTASLCNKRNQTNVNVQNLKKVQNELTNLYLKEQTEHIKNQISKIRDSIADKQCWISWETVNEMSRRKSTTRANVKATSQEERINRKVAKLDEIPPKISKSKEFDDILLQYCNAVYNQNTIDGWTKCYILLFPKTVELGIAGI